MTRDDYDRIEDERAELDALDRARKAYRAKLARHPHCDDPEHPGCSQCVDEEDPEE